MGSCPYEGCNGSLVVPVDDGAGKLLRHNCDDCGRPIWTYLSRIDPWSMTEADFLGKYIVNEATKEITLRFTTVPP